MEQYYYLNSNNEQAGPISPADFSRYGINETTMIWTKGMPNWMRVGQIPELLQYINPIVPPPPSRNGFGGGEFRPIKPDNNMLWAILVSLFCCLPVGIYSVIQAAKVNDLYNSGKYNEAQQMADAAKKWAIISAILGLVAWVFYFFLGIFSGFFSSTL
ncbi:MAG TPA: CD225/dispanin family protein [Candidatus Odoribacter faecigallinarum]|uniref:CD225/dispanin family protein n=1 Tax=Candidatus Odoribacter faecigallinarum TaxID=2838706 RepID=A0A9D1UZA0_9BACT|nr:CD225/dispanin family protein [Candidatus Odoribacter faecigallinarum]